MQQTDQFEKIIISLQNQLRSMQTSHANPAMVETIIVDAYNAKMPLQELATIQTPEPQLLVIQPWDKSVIKNIESALRESKLQLNPVINGPLIRIAFPPPTEERRKELVKYMKNIVEESHIAIRKTREQLLKEIKEQKKNSEISEDDFFYQEKEIQHIVDDYNEKIKKIEEAKANELMSL
ncbi:MAG TPA: ribosome recycling factor [Patescibacteria group bacterium]|nr:ribosome recycling factor [Patescibacteria group bacterium]